MDEVTGLLRSLKVRPLAQRRIRKGALLFTSGDPVACFYVVGKGSIRMERSAPDGVGITIYVAGPGHAFAEASLFSDTYHCDAVAVENSELLVYSKPRILAALREHSDAALGYMAHLARHVQTLRTRLGVIHIKSARERLLVYIRSQLPVHGCEVELSGNWKAISSELHLAHETVYRELARLEREGVLARKGMHITFR